MAGTVCGGTVQLCALRLANLEPNGVPKPGAGNLYVTDQQIQLKVTVELTEGIDVEQLSGCGLLCVAFKDCDRLKRVNFELELCTPEPELTHMLVPGTLLTSGGQTRGYAFPRVGQGTCPNGVSMEAWVKHIVGGAQHPSLPWYRFIFPRTFWQFDDKELKNDVITHPYKGFANENENWFNGPANDWPYASTSLAAYAMDTGIPSAVCGAQTLVAS